MEQIYGERIKTAKKEIPLNPPLPKGEAQNCPVWQRVVRGDLTRHFNLKGILLIMLFLPLLPGLVIAANFTDNGDGTVTDRGTGLMWQQQNDDVKRTWQEALSYCEGLDFANFNNWKLPDIKELESITDDTKYDPAIDETFFQNTNSSSYWSSSNYGPKTTNAWFVSFTNGNVFYQNLNTSEGYVRCVR